MVARADIQQVLHQMRQVKADMQSQVQATVPSFVERVDQMHSTSQLSSASSTASKINSIHQGPVSQNYPYIQPDPNIPNFKTMFGNAINEVNRKQTTASELAVKFEQGDPQIDLPEVMVALQKASVSFQAMTEVRNKLVEAYKDIMNMPL